jgi:hypothetical protein
VVESFDGQITVTQGRTGDRFDITESAQGEASGAFVTRGSAGSTPIDRQKNLALPVSNTARVEGNVELNRNQILLEGDVASQVGTPGFPNTATGGGRQVFTDAHNGGVTRIGSPLTVNDLSKAASVPDKGGFSVAGRSLTKHGSGARDGNSVFPPAKGNQKSINQQAQDLVDDILTNPKTKIIEGNRGRFGATTEYITPEGRGIVFGKDGKFLFFREGTE